jgi:hypothetical protein
MITKLAIFIILIVLLFSIYKYYSYRVVNLEKSDNYYYTFLNREVHYVPMGNRFELGDLKLDGVDPKSVQILGSHYLKDKYHVYFNATKITRADPGTFEMICTNKGSFARDKNMIYFESNSFKDLDISSFQFAGGNCGPIIKDKNHVYSVYPFYAAAYGSDGNSIIPPLPDVSPEKYQFINEFYGKDDHVAYFKGMPIEGSDAKTFILSGDYAKDRSRVYFDGLEVKDMDPATFIPIDGGGYTRDKHGVYYGLDAVEDQHGHPVNYTGRLVAGADPETFTMIKGEKVDYGKDKTRYFWGGVAQ